VCSEVPSTDVYPEDGNGSDCQNVGTPLTHDRANTQKAKVAYYGSENLRT
jgi:hypothetical protein